MAQTFTNAECIYSRLGSDPDLGDIVAMFAEEMPKRVASLLDCARNGNWENLRKIAHQIKGAAGSYGFDAVSPAAGRVESAIHDGEPEERIREAVAELVDLCGRIRCGRPSLSE